MNLKAFFSPVLADTDKKIVGLHKLKQGWRYGSGDAIALNVLGIARYLNRIAEGAGFTASDAFPGKEGDLTLALYYEGKDFSFRIFPSEKIDFWSETEEDVNEADGLELGDAAALIIALKKSPKWNLFYSFTLPTTTVRFTDLGVLRSAPPAMAAGYLLFATNASSKERVASATTPESIILQSRRSPRFSGNLIPDYCLPA